jgi:hypothetical protein
MRVRSILQRDSESEKRTARLSRRRLLAALSSASLLTLLAACRPRTLEPTPTPTRTARGSPPSSTPSGTPTPSATWTPSATATSPNARPRVLGTPTGTPTATAGKPPTSTPTPTATPFPPGPPTKLGLVITRNDPRVFDLLATGNVATICTLEYDPNFASDIKAVSPKTLLIGRITLPQLDLASLTDPESAGRSFAEQLLPIATEPRRLAAFDGWQAYNEPVVADGEQMARLARFEAARTRILAKAGVRSVIGNFGTGHPDLALWPQFRPALEAAKRYEGYLGLHEYSAPTMQYGTPQDPLGWDTDPAQEGWLTLRYRKVFRGYLEPNRLVLPLILTEVGIDGMVGNRPGPPGKGWQDFAAYWDQLGMGSDAPGNYMEQLAWYDANLQQDDYVKGAAIFAAAASPGWESYELLGDERVEPFLSQYFSVHPVRGS